MQERTRERLIYAAGLLATGAHVARAVWLGPQQIGERPLAKPHVWAANYLGFWAITWLIATLACTPARLWLGATWPARWRRTLGLTTALLVAVHVLTWQIGESGADLGRGLALVAQKPWLWAGALGLLVTLVLAATSPVAVVKQLGALRWRQVHRSVYGLAVLAVLHYALRETADPQHWLAFGLVLALLLAARQGKPTQR